MTIVIPFCNTPTNIELRYSLRSLTGHEIVIVGDKPYGFKNYLHIPAGDKQGNQYKEANIFRKLIKACRDDRVSDPFVYSMDDVFYLQPPINENYYQKDLQWKIQDIRDKNRDNPYRKTMQNTLAVLLKNGYKTTHYDIHGPTVIHKEGFLDLLRFDWKQEYSYGIRSIYGNVNKVEAASIADCKIDRPHLLDELYERVEGRRFFSIGDSMNATLRYFLDELWPEPSAFEE